MAIKKPLDEKLAEEALEKCVRRIASPKDREFMREILGGLIRNNAIPLEILDSVPVPARKAGKTRFDQIYDAVMALVFPDYRENTLVRLLGPKPPEPGIKIWRAVFPERFKITHILFRAHTYAEAFALACDYACRLSLLVYKKVPVDLSIRVMFMSEGALRRHLTLREVNRKKRRRDLLVEAREFTPKQINGARIAAAGPPRDPRYSIFRYVERKDLRNIREEGGPARVSAVQSESYSPKARKSKPEPL